MCENCGDGEDVDPVMTRRQWLALAGAAGAVLLAGCREEPKHPGAGSQPATQAAEPLGVPDLGAEVFADASGRAIARPADAPVIIIPRSDWTAYPPNFAQMRRMNGVQRITVHHTAWKTEADAWSPTAGELEHIREFHSGTGEKDRGWTDIAYHFVVDRAGRVWQARPLAYQGAHVKGRNEHNLGIVLLGNFDLQSPSAAQLIALSNFIVFVRGLYGVPLDEVYTHGELGKTGCPGKRLQAFMDRVRKTWRAPAAV
jgi:hypothetical protein